MKKRIETYSLFVSPKEKSKKIADQIRLLNKITKRPFPLKEIENDGDLVIAIGGDGTFIDAVTSTGFSKEKIYVGVHTGTLGFLQDLSTEDIPAFINCLRYEKDIKSKTKKVFIPSITVNLNTRETLHYHAVNEVLIGGEHYAKIGFEEYADGELLHRILASAILIASNTGDTAQSRSAGGPVVFGNYSQQLTRTLIMPISHAVNERFLTSSILSPNFYIVLEPADNIEIMVDGILKEINSSEIKSIRVSMDDSDYINKFQLKPCSKVETVRNKILGYD